jgi:hypothetical protein
MTYTEQKIVNTNRPIGLLYNREDKFCSSTNICILKQHWSKNITMLVSIVFVLFLLLNQTL